MTAAGGAGGGLGGTTTFATVFGPGTIIPAFESLPLHERARAAAKVLRDVNDRAKNPLGTAYTASRLEILAEDWAAQFDRNAKRETEIEAFARDLFATRHPGASWEANPCTVADTKVAARKLYDAGYRKSGDGQ
ncbi:hypothetical protein [Mycolicibacterium brisbanense]|uniref:Uncharacterized protein n=1 Tax=Mycolicibacterium brisbanense TaxID=146020 RepID=A0A100W6M1_9MYCO|nr:hypothetical protein [Mycolicibacterium brisbanense]MCV7157999.1 hypothetical protein [Mycolicibacterium brisbanense]GAS92647.1 uncharacterized protein RMCB_6743 [Mycolicibacterium brisbanense]